MEGTSRGGKAGVRHTEMAGKTPKLAKGKGLWRRKRKYEPKSSELGLPVFGFMRGGQGEAQCGGGAEGMREM